MQAANVPNKEYTNNNLLPSTSKGKFSIFYIIHFKSFFILYSITNQICTKCMHLSTKINMFLYKPIKYIDLVLFCQILIVIWSH